MCAPPTVSSQQRTPLPPPHTPPPLRPPPRRLALYEGAAAGKKDSPPWVETKPRHNVQLMVRCNHLLDLTAEPVRQAICRAAMLPPPAAAAVLTTQQCDELLDMVGLAGGWKGSQNRHPEPLTQAIGRLASEVGFGGLIAPSNEARHVPGAGKTYNSVWFVKVDASNNGDGKDSKPLADNKDGKPSLITLAPASFAALEAITLCPSAAAAEPPPYQAPLDFAAGRPSAAAAAAAALKQHPSAKKIAEDHFAKLAFTASDQANAHDTALLFRYQSAAFLPRDKASLVAGAYAGATGGTWNPPGTNAIYLAANDEAAFAEFAATASAPLPPAVLLSFDFSDARTCYLTREGLKHYEDTVRRRPRSLSLSLSLSGEAQAARALTSTATRPPPPDPLTRTRSTLRRRPPTPRRCARPLAASPPLAAAPC